MSAGQPSLMKNIFAAIFVGFLVIGLVFLGIGGSFDLKFWLSFLPGLMENLVALAGAVFIIDRIRGNQRLAKLEQTNAGQARFVLFMNNRFAFHLLEHLGLATKDEFHKDAGLTFEFAHDRLKNINLADTFYRKLMESKNKEDFTAGFEKY